MQRVVELICVVHGHEAELGLGELKQVVDAVAQAHDLDMERARITTAAIGVPLSTEAVLSVVLQIEDEGELHGGAVEPLERTLTCTATIDGAVYGIAIVLSLFQRNGALKAPPLGTVLAPLELMTSGRQFMEPEPPRQP